MVQNRADRERFCIGQVACASARNAVSCAGDAAPVLRCGSEPKKPFLVCAN